MGAMAGYNAYQKRYAGRTLRGTARRTGAMSKMAMVRRMQRRRGRRGRMSKRTWKAQARRKVGNAKNYSTAKTTESVNPGTTAIGPGQGDFTGVRAVSTKTISSSPLIIIDGTSTNEIDERQRDMCVVSGIKIDATFQNQLTSRIYVNWGVIHGKQGQTISAATTDFFRDYQSSRTFDAAHNGKTGLTSSVAQINTDEFVVLARGKFLLTPFGNEAQNGLYNHNNNTKEKSVYLKLGRSFYFDDSATQPQDQVYFVVWPSIPEENTSAVTTQALAYKLRAICYWREPRTA